MAELIKPAFIVPDSERASEFAAIGALHHAATTLDRTVEVETLVAILLHRKTQPAGGTTDAPSAAWIDRALNVAQGALEFLRCAQENPDVPSEVLWMRLTG